MEIITSIKPGYVNDYDGRHLPDLVENDLKKGIEVKVVAAGIRDMTMVATTTSLTEGG